jgi:oxygen-independent coproporphyrinogen-3 oxidase
VEEYLRYLDQEIARVAALTHPERVVRQLHWGGGTPTYLKPADIKTLWRNFQGYTTHKHCDIYAFGASSISQTADVYLQNEKKIGRYQQLVGSGHLPVERGLRLTRDDHIRRDAITKIMCDLELDLAAFGVEWDIDFASYFADALAADGLVQLEPGRIVVTDLGRLFLRNIAMVFDSYLRQASSDQPRYSRTA